MVQLVALYVSDSLKRTVLYELFVQETALVALYSYGQKFWL